MMKSYLKVSFFILLGLFLVSCAAHRPLATFDGVDLNPKVQSGQLIQKVDNFLVILDASGSMDASFRGKNKLDIAKNFVNRMNQTIPNIKLNGGLRCFGGTANPFAKGTALIYGMTGYNKAGLDGAIKMIKEAKGDTPMSTAITAAGGDLKSAKGDIAVIIVSDGKATDKGPVQAAANLKRQYGNRICIYTVVVGNDPAGIKNMRDIANAGKCGFTIPEGSTAASPAMARFVEKVFFRSVLDADGDGVVDGQDQCPNTPQGVAVDARGCPLDSDGDGVPDYMDKCPGTPKWTKVDAKGCPLKKRAKGPRDWDKDGVTDRKDKCPGTLRGAKVNEDGCWIIMPVHFDTDKYNIKPMYYLLLNDVAHVLKKNPSVRLKIKGHTDNKASTGYNQSLSDRRAEAVKQYFIEKGIGRFRLITEGFGLTMPVAPNTTRAGMAKNRRVELKPIR